MNHYTVHSTYGEFEVVPTAELRKRVNEIGALALREQNTEATLLSGLPY